MDRLISFDEVESAQWVVINDLVYDIDGQWGDDVHPGGSYVVKKWKGRDATREFHSLHSAETKAIVGAENENPLLPTRVGRLAPIPANHEVELNKMDALVRAGIPIEKVFQMGNCSPSVLRSLCRRHPINNRSCATVDTASCMPLSSEQARQICRGVASMASVSYCGKKTHRTAYLNIMEDYYGTEALRQWAEEASQSVAPAQWQQDYAEWLKDAKERAVKLTEEEKRENLLREQEEIAKEGGSAIIDFWKQGTLHATDDSIDLWRKFRTESLGHRETDEEHREILEAFDALEEDPTVERLQHLRDALQRHFQHEEQLMLNVGIPMEQFVVHHAQHHNFLSWAYGVSCAQEFTAVQQFARGCKQRFKNHSEYTDARYMRFIVDEDYAQRIRSSTNGLQ